jgi:hypothetical protein
MDNAANNALTATAARAMVRTIATQIEGTIKAATGADVEVTFIGDGRFSVFALPADLQRAWAVLDAIDGYAFESVEEDDEFAEVCAFYAPTN